MNQAEIVAEYLVENGSLSIYENELGIKNISACISVLRKRGMNIVSNYHTNLDKKGVYTLIEDGSDSLSIKYPRQENKKLWKIWSCMRQRCNYPKDDSYEHYGAKGIKVCQEWNVNFQAFAEWALSNGYKDGLTIDRIDSTKGYEPANCRFATAKEQANNRSSNHPLTFRGCTKNMAEWSDEFNLPRHVVSKRIKAGWSVEKTLTTPVRKKKPNGYYKNRIGEQNNG